MTPKTRSRGPSSSLCAGKPGYSIGTAVQVSLVLAMEKEPASLGLVTFSGLTCTCKQFYMWLLCVLHSCVGVAERVM